MGSQSTHLHTSLEGVETDNALAALGQQQPICEGKEQIREEHWGKQQVKLGEGQRQASR